jgi:hypothetical protein
MCDREVCVSGLWRGFFSQFPFKAAVINHESRRLFWDNVVFKIVFARHECKRRQKNCLNKVAFRTARQEVKSKSMNGIGDEYKNSQLVVGGVRAAF